VDTKKIKFVANRSWITADCPSRPGPIVKTLPDWYRNADWFVPDRATGKPAEAPDGGGKMPTWKACPAILDVMGTGYTYKTPCDIEFAEDTSGDIHARVLDTRYENVLQDREPMPQFFHPRGYHQKHFAWWPDWAVELPEGYSALYTHPIDRFELPFLTMSRIVDNDKVHLPGTMPFFMFKGVRGILPAGTPYAQIIPFKRDHWESEIDASLTPEQMSAKSRGQRVEVSSARRRRLPARSLGAKKVPIAPRRARARSARREPIVRGRWPAYRAAARSSCRPFCLRSFSAAA
jgi:hypothetical protein